MKPFLICTSRRRWFECDPQHFDFQALWQAELGRGVEEALTRGGRRRAFGREFFDIHSLGREDLADFSHDARLVQPHDIELREGARRGLG